MIISASRRTDIPAFYSGWFFNRLKEGYVLVRNPMNIRQISKVLLTPDVVDCIVFWSKNPKNMLSKLTMLNGYHYYFQFTLNSYNEDVETAVPPKKIIIETFKALSEKIGSERVIWRYDPVLINKNYTISYHIENFEKTASELRSYTKKVTISFIDLYSKTERNTSGLSLKELDLIQKYEIAGKLAKIAQKNFLTIDTCAEDIDLSQYGILHARCIDDNLIKQITGYSLDVKKDKSQRLECGCVASIDIGVYNTCRHGCLYCYANYNNVIAAENMKKHNPLSPLLLGEYAPADKYIDRKAKSDKIAQQDLFSYGENIKT